MVSVVRAPAKGAEAHQHSEWTVEKMSGVRSPARTVQRRVATVTLHMAEQCPNKSAQVSCVAFPTVRQVVRARDRCRARDRLRVVHQVPAGLR